MTVAELIEKLLEQPQGLTVTISDGFRCVFYDGEYAVTQYLADGDVMKVDIGIGGCDEESE